MWLLVYKESIVVSPLRVCTSGGSCIITGALVYGTSVVVSPTWVFTSGGSCIITGTLIYILCIVVSPLRASTGNLTALGTRPVLSGVLEDPLHCLVNDAHACKPTTHTGR
jgi:hypothetical protein